jgi:hypothetical protein
VYLTGEPARRLSPLTIPAGSIGLVVGGIPVRHPHAGRILFGVVVGLELILLAPSIVA